MTLELLEDKPKEEDECFQSILKIINECDGCFVITRKGNSYYKSWFSMRKEERIFWLENIKKQILEEEG